MSVSDHTPAEGTELTRDLRGASKEPAVQNADASPESASNRVPLTSVSPAPFVTKAAVAS